MTTQLENSLDDERMKTAEEILTKSFGGYVGETKVYITDKDLLIKAMQTYADQQLEEYKQALRELIPIAGFYHDQTITYSEMPYKNWSAIIDKARKLLETPPK